jgi:hypothetical protein
VWTRNPSFPRYLDIYEDDLIAEAQLAGWVRQASELPGQRM